MGDRAIVILAIWITLVVLATMDDPDIVDAIRARALSWAAVPCEGHGAEPREAEDDDSEDGAGQGEEE